MFSIKYWQWPVIINELILLHRQSGNRSTLLSQQHLILYREPVETAGSSSQDWEIGCAKRSTWNISIVSSSDVARTQSRPFPTWSSRTLRLYQEKKKVEHHFVQAEPPLGWQHIVYATVECLVAATCCWRIHIPLKIYKERSAEILHIIV